MISPAELRATALMRDSSEETIAFIARNAADLRVDSGDWILREGETARFFIVIEGTVEILRTVTGRLAVVGEYGAGDSFGEVPLLLGSPAVATIRAKSKARLARLDATTFWHVMHSEPPFAHSVFVNMSRRVEYISEAAVKAPSARCTIVGDSRSPACHELRDFLTRVHVPYEWEERNGTECEVTYVDAPSQHSPNVSQLAEGLGLSIVPHKHCYDVVIVGGGPAGLAAAVYGASEGLKTLLLDRYAPGGQAGMSSRIENYLGFPAGISGEELAARAFVQARGFGADIVVLREARAIEGDEYARRVVLENGEVVHAHTAVVATGVAYSPLDADGCDTFLNRGVFYGAAQTEARSVAGHDIHILGSGNSAGQAAIYFAPYARSVKIITHDKDLTTRMSQYLIEQVMRQQNVTPVYESTVAAVDGSDRLERVAVKSLADDRIQWEPSSALFVFIGAVPKSDWLSGFLALDDRGYVLTGTPAKAASTWPLSRDPYFLETSQPGVFAAGDVRKDSVKRVAASVGEGSSAIALIHTYLAKRP